MSMVHPLIEAAEARVTMDHDGSAPRNVAWRVLLDDEPICCFATEDEAKLAFQGARAATVKPAQRQVLNQHPGSPLSDDPGESLRADRDRWRHEYRIEKQKNALMRSDLRSAKAQIGELQAALKHCRKEIKFLVEG